ncbi:MAG: Dps family protein [Planctomycetota bacterium JB042]
MNGTLTSKLPYSTPSPLAEADRDRVVDALNQLLADGLDLHARLKMAHWNVRGPLFPTLHPLFEQLADGLALQNDAVAERAVTLGGLARGGLRTVTAESSLGAERPEVTKDLEVVRVVAGDLETYLTGVRAGRSIADGAGDTDSADLLTAIVTEFEKHAWFLRATLGE